MEKINCVSNLEEAKRYDRWLLFYDFPWAPSGVNMGAFLFWVHRKHTYLNKEFRPLPIYESTEGNCLELDQWISSHMKETGENLVGSGWGSVILCRRDQFLAAAPMLVETGINHLTRLVETVYAAKT